MASGFKIADAYVDVQARVDDAAVAAAGRRAGERAGDSLSDAVERTSHGSGQRWGEGFTRGADGRLRDSRGKFVKWGDGIGDEGGRSGGGKFSKGFFGTIMSGLSTAGHAITDGLGGAMKAGGPYVAAALTVILVGAAVAVAPLLGATIGAGILAGVAGAGIGLGIAAAMRDPAVKGALGGLKSDFMSVVDDIGDDWRGTVIGAINSSRSPIREIGSQLRIALAPARAYVQPLLDGFLGLVRNVIPGFRTGIEGAKPVIDAIARTLPQLGTALAYLFRTMAAHGDEMASALTLVLQMLGGMIMVGADILGWLSSAYVKTLEWGSALARLNSNLPGEIGRKWGALGDYFDDLIGVAKGAGSAMDGASGAAQRSGVATLQAAAGSAEMAARQTILTGTLRAGITAAGGFAGMLDRLNGAAQSVEQSEIALKEAIQGATQASQNNGRTLNINTEAGRANRTALLNLAQAASTHAQRVYDQTNATKGSAAAERSAVTAYESGRAALIRAARQMGMNASEARNYANKVMAIPKSWTTNVKANTGQATSAVTTVKRQIQSITGKTVTVTVQYRQLGNGNIHVSGPGGSGTLLKRWGGITEYAQEGLVRLRDAGYFPAGESTRYGFAERATGGEAFIPRLGDRVRSLGILAQAAAWYGQRLVSTTGGQERAERSAPAMPAVSGGHATHYHFAPGSVVLDASGLRSIQDVVDMIQRLGISARTFRARGTALVGA